MPSVVQADATGDVTTAVEVDASAELRPGAVGHAIAEVRDRSSPPPSEVPAAAEMDATGGVTAAVERVAPLEVRSGVVEGRAIADRSSPPPSEFPAAAEMPVLSLSSDPSSALVSLSSDQVTARSARLNPLARNPHGFRDVAIEMVHTLTLCP